MRNRFTPAVVSVTAATTKQSNSFKRISKVLGIFALLVPCLAIAQPFLIPGPSGGCPLTDLVENVSCAPEMTVDLTVSLPLVYEDAGTLPAPSYAVYKFNGGESWKLDAVGPFSAVERDPPLMYVPQYTSRICSEEGLLYIPYIVLPDGDPVREIVLRRDEANLLVWHVDWEVPYVAGNPCE